MQGAELILHEEGQLGIVQMSKKKLIARHATAFAMMYLITLLPAMGIHFVRSGISLDIVERCLLTHTAAFCFIGGTLAVAIMFQKR